MKVATFILLLLLPVAALAQNHQNYQNYQGMNQQDMQKMMQQMQAAQECMQNVDQEKLNEIQKRSEQFSKELEALCAAGKRDEAHAKAISYGKKFANDPTIKTVQKCGEMMEGAMPQMPYMKEYKDEDYSKDHVCD